MTRADEGADAPHREFRRVAVVVGVVASLTFLWLITVGRPNLVPARDFGDVFDLQARALLDGRLSMPDGSLGFEGFLIDGKTYAYFGIFPSLIRLPILLVTDHFDGRLTVVSMLVAYVIAYVSAARVISRTRALLRPDTTWSRAGLAAAGLLLLVVGLGSNLLFLGSAAWMYHEASLWGAAAVLASFAATLSYLARPRLRPVLVAGAWATVAWLSRGSVGLAPAVVLGLLGLAHLSGARWLAVLAPRPTPPSDGELHITSGAEPEGSAPALRWERNPRLAMAFLAAAAVGGLLFGAINTAKFGSPTRLPMDRQVASFNPWPERREALEVYDGSLFSVRLIPSVLVQTFRPDLLGPSSTWPFVRQRPVQPPVWGDLVFDTVEPSSGLTLTSPLLLVLATVGVVAAVRPRRPGARGTSAAPLRPFLLGGLAATYAPLTIAFIAQRYLTDALPLLIVAAAGGVAVVDGWSPTPAQGRRTRAFRARSLALGALVVLAAFGTFVTLATSWSYQRFGVPPDGAARAAGLRTQLAVAEVVGSPPSATRYASLPGQAPKAGLAVRGDCLGLYQGQPDGGWSPVEVSAAGGQLALRARVDTGTTNPSSALVTVGEADDHVVVTVEGSGDASRFRLVRNGVAGRVGPEVDLGGGDHRVEVQADPTLAWVKVFVDGDEALFEAGRPPLRSTLAPGQDPFGAVPDFVGFVDELPTPTPTCDALVAAGD